MAKKEKAVYAPGELNRVREKLGVFDREEANQLAQKLGGEIGYERTYEEQKALQNPQRTRHERVEVKIGDQPGRSVPKRRVEIASEYDFDGEEPQKKKSSRRKSKGTDPSDDPSVPLKVSYWDRLKMDRFAGQPEFEIKSQTQIFQSMISILHDTPDYVSHFFVTRRMPEYYKKIETLVVSTRYLFPRNNLRRNERMKKSAPVVYSILDVIRYWNIEKISGDLGKIQANPRNARVSDFAEILKAFYRPLFVLDRLDPDAHIRGAYKILYKLLYIENPIEAQSKYQDLIRTTLAAFFEVRRDIHYLLHPMLMKLVSARYVPYENLFSERKNRIMAFLNVSEADMIDPAVLTMQGDAKDLKPGEEELKEKEREAAEKKGKEGQAEWDSEEVISEEEKVRRSAVDAEKKALERGLQALEALFPKAGWDRLATYPDLYPYFVDTLGLKRGIVNVAPTDPLQQIFILMRILEELFFGLRYVSFGDVTGPGGNTEKLDIVLMEIINNWHYYIEMSFGKEYLPRMTEYVRILEGSYEERTSAYTRKLISEMHWIKRLFFLPFYKFESFMPPPIQKKDISPVYVITKNLRRYLTAVAAGIDYGTRAGGAETRALCDGINNPWEPYVFQVSNPLSIRLDALLGPKAKNNASLIYFCLAVTTVLDHIVNNEDSWAYSPRPGPLFRSINGEGVMPLTGVDDRIDADNIFRQSIKQRQKKA